MSRWLEGHKAVSTELPLHILTAFLRAHLAFTACLVRLLLLHKTFLWWQDILKDHDRPLDLSMCLYCNYVRYLSTPTELKWCCWKPSCTAMATTVVSTAYLSEYRAMVHILWACTKYVPSNGDPNATNEDATALLLCCRRLDCAHIMYFFMNTAKSPWGCSPGVTGSLTLQINFVMYRPIHFINQC